MSQSARILLCFAGLSLFAATGLGAYASHAAASAIDAQQLLSLRIAIDYQFYNSLGLLAVAILADRFRDATLLRMSGFVVLAGTVLFCGAIYAKTFGAPPAFGRAAPVGGTALMVGWLAFAGGAWRATHRSNH